MMEITTLSRDQVPAAAEKMAMAFMNYPEFTYYFPDQRRREKYLAWFLRAVIGITVEHGTVFTTRDQSSLLCAYSPDDHRAEFWDYRPYGFLLLPWAMGWRNFYNMMHYEKTVFDTRRHLLGGVKAGYVWLLGVSPAAQGAGTGTNLVRHFQQQAADEGYPIYLETHADSNLRFYQKLGFRLLDDPHKPEPLIPFYSLLWEPDASQA